MPDPKDHYDFTQGKHAIRRDDDPVAGKKLAQQGKVWAVGMNFAFTVMGGGVIGWLLQAFVFKNAKPWPILIGLGCGMMTGLVQFIREANKLNRPKP
jgi:F0F1-type ATP synthase assembly protein I